MLPYRRGLRDRALANGLASTKRLTVRSNASKATPRTAVAEAATVRPVTTLVAEAATVRTLPGTAQSSLRIPLAEEPVRQSG